MSEFDALLRDLPPVIEGDRKSQRIHEVFRNAIKKDERCVSARMWAYLGVTLPLNVFDITVSRHRDGPDAFLANDTGKLMADC